MYSIHVILTASFFVYLLSVTPSCSKPILYRTTVTAPTVKTTGPVQSPGREIKIPVSSRDPEEVEPEPSPGVPKHTPATTVEKK